MVSVSRSARRLILPWANSSSLVAMKPSMVSILLLAPERVFLDRVGDLDVVIERIVDVQAAVAPGGGVEPFCSQRATDLAFVPIGNRVADMVNHGLGRLGRIGARIVHNEEIATLVRPRTEGEIRAALSLVVQHLHAEH